MNYEILSALQLLNVVSGATAKQRDDGVAVVGLELAERRLDRESTVRISNHYQRRACRARGTAIPVFLRPPLGNQEKLIAVEAGHHEAGVRKSADPSPCIRASDDPQS